MNIPFENVSSRATAQSHSGKFAFSGPKGSLFAAGAQRAVPPGLFTSLETRLADAFARANDHAIVGGAFPFRRDQPDHLWIADRATHQPMPFPATPMRLSASAIQRDPTTQIYEKAVMRALHLLRGQTGLPTALRKVVLARTLSIAARQTISVEALMAHLSEDDSVTAFRVALPGGPGRYLVGATPELLLEKRGRTIMSHPLAGSARRGTTTRADALACTTLARSEKDQREHAMVVEYILDTLAPFCVSLDCPDGMRLTATRSMWHLGTLIRGTLRDATVPVPVLAARLHPTPAVCGLPPRCAADLISELEPFDRGFYSGAVGWCDATGDGAWFVAIRCAEICGRHARLFAGAGIVEGSDPQAEAAETGNKFAAMLRALGLSETAGMADDLSMSDN